LLKDLSARGVRLSANLTVKADMAKFDAKGPILTRNRAVPFTNLLRTTTAHPSRSLECWARKV
jgi:hypothetical protein